MTPLEPLARLAAILAAGAQRVWEHRRTANKIVLISPLAPEV
jgi:hypothetical protein